KKEREYVSIANAILQNKALTWEARGVMAYLLSKPDGWECRNYDLVNQGPASEHIIRRVLKELQEAGYIHRYRKSEGRGKIEWITEIYETPELNTALRNGTFSNVENFEIESYDLEKSVDIVSTDSNKDRQLEKTDLNGCAKKPQKSINNLERKQTLNYLADQIATLCQVDVNLASTKTRDGLKTVTLALYGKSISPADLNSFKDWWYNEYWAGKKGQPPTPAQVGDTWGQFETSKATNATIKTDGDGGFYV
ncbi:MAG: hypothetical protein ACYTEW_21950, partial [Planctomycetota bacterium]